jgi:DNA topoisomerase-3
LRRHVEATKFGPYVPFVHTLLAQGTLTLTARHVDDTKVTDHHAIIPTEQRVDPAALSPDEKRLLTCSRAASSRPFIRTP